MLWMMGMSQQWYTTLRCKWKQEEIQKYDFDARKKIPNRFSFLNNLLNSLLGILELSPVLLSALKINVFKIMSNVNMEKRFPTKS